MLMIKYWKMYSLHNEKHIQKLIHDDQTGYPYGRYIDENINRLLKIIDEEHIPAIPIVIDFKKAFDNL